VAGVNGWQRTARLVAPRRGIGCLPPRERQQARPPPSKPPPRATVAASRAAVAPSLVCFGWSPLRSFEELVACPTCCAFDIDSSESSV
jgi:hypothetical protein